MKYITENNRHLSINRIEKRHLSFRNQKMLTEKYGLIQRIIILLIIISCIALVATGIGVF